MAAVYSCRYERLALVAAVLFGVDAGEIPPCDEPAEFASEVRLKVDGFESESYTRTCVEHDLQARDVPGYRRSIKLRHSPPDLS